MSYVLWSRIYKVAFQKPHVKNNFIIYSHIHGITANTYRAFTCTHHYSKCFMFIRLFNPHNYFFFIKMYSGNNAHNYSYLHFQMKIEAQGG